MPPSLSWAEGHNIRRCVNKHGPSISSVLITAARRHSRCRRPSPSGGSAASVGGTTRLRTRAVFGVRSSPSRRNRRSDHPAAALRRRRRQRRFGLARPTPVPCRSPHHRRLPASPRPLLRRGLMVVACAGPTEKRRTPTHLIPRRPP